LPRRSTKLWPLAFYTYSFSNDEAQPELRHHVAASPEEYLRILRGERTRPGVRSVIAEERVTGKKLK
jgi:hypothetical protein